MPFIQSTTPTIRIGIPKTLTTDLSSCKLFATVAQDSYSVTKSGTAVSLEADPSGKYKQIAKFTLTQAQTAKFSYRIPVEIQLFWINSAGTKQGIVAVQDKVYKALDASEVSYV